MKPKNWLNCVAIIVLLGVVFMGGYFEGQKTQIIACDSPYIKIGNSCCLDRNHNRVCDKDETEKELLDTCLKENIDSCISENVVGNCTTDLSCIEMSNRYCGRALETCNALIDKKCEFGPLGVECR